MGEMRILSGRGDTKVIWDPDNNAEIRAAEKQFNSLIEDGFNAFRVKKDGNKGKVIKKFDPKAGKLIMVPKIRGG